MRTETIGDATLYLGDCREVLPSLGRVDAVVTDPPYGMSLNADYSGFKHTDGSPGVAYQPIIGDDEAFDPAPLLALGKPMVLWGAQYYASRLPDVGGWLVFNKRGDGAPSAICFGDAELAWCNSGNQAVRIYSQMWHGLTRWRTEGREHPTQKPVGLMEWCIEQLPPAITILDPFMGSGTTGVACARLGRKFIGIEIDPTHYETALRRIEAEYRQPRLFTEPTPKAVQEALF